jgi:hypothetical protein
MVCCHGVCLRPTLLISMDPQHRVVETRAVVKKPPQFRSGRKRPPDRAVFNFWGAQAPSRNINNLPVPPEHFCFVEYQMQHNAGVCVSTPAPAVRLRLREVFYTDKASSHGKVSPVKNGCVFKRTQLSSVFSLTEHTYYGGQSSRDHGTDKVHSTD